MPSRNITKIDTPDSYYHAYSRGINKSNIFNDDEDKDYLLYLFSRHLSNNPFVGGMGYPYPHYRGALELLTYCLMDNHFHFLFYQRDKGSLSKMMQSVLTAYTAYFNRKHERTGPLFESRFKASLIDKDPYLLHVSRYILLNPRSWKNYKYSSIKYMRNKNEPEWLQANKVLSLFDNRKSYLEFVADYKENKEMLAELKYQLANL